VSRFLNARTFQKVQGEARPVEGGLLAALHSAVKPDELLG
jgi:hypothetical protein